MSDRLEFSPGDYFEITKMYSQCKTKRLDVLTEVAATSKKLYHETVFIVTNLLTGDIHRLKTFDEAVKKYNELR